ncbi:MAG: rod shape-determining protein MreD, partial [Steroidobacter sp.]
MSDGRISRWRITGTVLLALIFAVLPLPDPLDAARPDLLLLLVIYLGFSAPRFGRLLFYWFCGLAIDVLKVIIQGKH